MNIDFGIRSLQSIKTLSANYFVSFFEPDDTLGEIVLIKPIVDSSADLWYVVRVTDVVLPEQSFVGQIAYKGTSKEAAIDVWKKEAHSYYIFNPKKCK